MSHFPAQNEPRQRVTNDAIRSIFFPRPDEPRSVLLKRGPVLVGGEERELSLFSGGFVLSRVEWNPLVDLLLDASSGKLRRSTSEALREKLLEPQIVGITKTRKYANLKNDAES